MEYLLHILILLGIYFIAAVALNLLVGYTGLLSIVHAGFFGTGAYVVAVMALRLGYPFWVGILGAAAITGILGFAISMLTLRVHDDCFVLVTFGMQVVITSVMMNWMAMTNGPMGLSGIPQPELFGFRFDTHARYLALTWLCAGGTFVFCRSAVLSPFGRVLRAIREDEVFAQALGKNVIRHKAIAFSMAAAIAAVAGGLYAAYVTFVDPTSFTIQESIFMLAIVIVGGAGNIWGSLLGAALLVTVPEALRFLNLASPVAGNLRQILYGCMLILTMIFRPRGLLGEYDFGYTKKGG